MGEKVDSFKLVNQLFLYGCKKLSDASGKVKDAKYWESMELLVNCLLFRSIMWIKEACGEFNKKFPKQEFLDPEEKINFFFLPKKNSYVFIVKDTEVNKEFIKFCLNHKEANKWLIQKEED